MCAYTTSEEHVPEDPEGDVTLQVTDTESREIFWTRARIARDPEGLESPEPLTVVRGPHENIEEEWYIEVIEARLDEGVDTELLRECLLEAMEGSDLLNARSAELRATVEYLVETGEYESLSAAVRSLLSAGLSEAHPDVTEALVEERTRLERDELGAMFGREDG
jgi:hypothetical protein